jgi:fructosamine-3-kinase
MFETESIGLNIIAASNTIKVPSCKGIIENDDYQCLLLEWIETGNPSAGFWKSFGKSLAKMHSLNSARTRFCVR